MPSSQSKNQSETIGADSSLSAPNRHNAADLLNLLQKQTEVRVKAEAEQRRISVKGGIESTRKLWKPLTPEQEAADAERVKQKRQVDAIRLFSESRVPRAHSLIVQDKRLWIKCEPWSEALRRVLGLLMPSRVGATVAVLGSYGTGKTQLAAFACYWCARNQLSSMYLKVDAMVQRLNDARNTDNAALEDVMDQYKTPYLLVLDEIDKRGETWYEDRVMCRVIDDRYTAGRSTLFMGNYTWEGFDAIIDPSIRDRIDERGEVIVCDWPNFRRLQPEGE